MEYPSLDIPKAGATRFNTDRSQLEIYDGNQWTGILSTSPEMLTGGTRGIYAGGNNSDVIDYVNIATTGNAADFGNLTKDRAEGGGFSNRNRALFGGDSVPGSDNTIDYITIATTGNASDFGDMVTGNAQSMGGLANATRGLWGGGYQSGQINILQYITIDTTGNAVDFGDLTSARSGPAGGSSPTRGIWAGGSPGPVNTIEYITISTTGNSADFGDMNQTDANSTLAGNAVRQIYFTCGSKNNTMEYITTATLGNAKDFGDMTITNHYSATSNASSTRATAGGGNYPSSTNVIDYVEIMHTGNAVDFGDLSTARTLLLKGCISNGHGGL